MFSNMEKNIPLCLIALITPIMATPNAIYDNVQTVQKVFKVINLVRENLKKAISIVP